MCESHDETRTLVIHLLTALRALIGACDPKLCPICVLCRCSMCCSSLSLQYAGAQAGMPSTSKLQVYDSPRMAHRVTQRMTQRMTHVVGWLVGWLFMFGS